MNISVAGLLWTTKCCIFLLIFFLYKASKILLNKQVINLSLSGHRNIFMTPSRKLIPGSPRRLNSDSSSCLPFLFQVGECVANSSESVLSRSDVIYEIYRNSYCFIKCFNAVLWLLFWKGHILHLFFYLQKCELCRDRMSLASVGFIFTTFTAQDCSIPNPV